jgi:hypothetical protein
MNKKCLIINIINNIIYKSLSLMKFWLKWDTKLYHIITDNVFFFLLLLFNKIFKGLDVNQ